MHQNELNVMNERMDRLTEERNNCLQSI